MSGLCIKRLDASEVEKQVPALAALLVDAVEQGAAVSFMQPLSVGRATDYWTSVVGDMRGHRRIFLAAFIDDELVGTVQVVPAGQPNGRHRAELIKMIVHSAHRQKGIGQQLMERAESEAMSEGLSLLFLDTEVSSAGERLYKRLNWQRVGEIPNYFLQHDGQLGPTVFYYKILGGQSGQ